MAPKQSLVGLHILYSDSLIANWLLTLTGSSLTFLHHSVSKLLRATLWACLLSLCVCSDICISCGSLNVSLEHPLFVGAMCHGCKVRMLPRLSCGLGFMSNIREQLICFSKECVIFFFKHKNTVSADFLSEAGLSDQDQKSKHSQSTEI